MGDDLERLHVILNRRGGWRRIANEKQNKLRPRQAGVKKLRTEDSQPQALTSVGLVDAFDKPFDTAAFSKLGMVTQKAAAHASIE